MGSTGMNYFVVDKAFAFIFHGYGKNTANWIFQPDTVKDSF